MKIFVAGATGIVGRRVVPLLVAEGHDVSAVARSADKAALVEGAGATPVTVDLFDATGIESAVAGHDAVINVATHIPPPSKVSMARAWRENDRIRRDASRILVDAALATDASIYVQESIGFFYVDRGDGWVDESTPVDLPKHGRSSADAEAQAARFTSHGRTGIALRFGMFYAPDSPQTQLQVKLARRGVSPFFGGADQYQPLIHVDDVATSVVSALGAAPGTYNVADDDPLTKGEAAAILAPTVGRKRLRAPNALWAASGSVVRALMRSQRVSNAAFKQATAWSPRFATVREGIPATVEAIEATR